MATGIYVVADDGENLALTLNSGPSMMDKAVVYNTLTHAFTSAGRLGAFLKFNPYFEGVAPYTPSFEIPAEVFEQLK